MQGRISMMLSRLLGLLSLPSLCTADALISVDLGSQFFKVCLLRPGWPLEIALNGHSKRKTPTAVSFHEARRTFGDDALPLQGKGAKTTLLYFTSILGANLSALPEVSATALGFHPKFFPYDIQKDTARSASLFSLGSKGQFATEEVVAQLLDFARSMAETSAEGMNLTELVLTLPSTFGQRQRRALLDSAEIAGFRRTSLIHESSAAAVHRAISIGSWLGKNGTKNSSTELIFNMGSIHTEVCIVRYSLVKSEPGRAPVPTVQVLACTTSSELGGSHFDLLVAEDMLKEFKKKYPKLSSIDESNRALKKLVTQAQATKHVLSANKEATFRVESLYEDRDFAHPITRESFEKLAEHLFKHIASPIDKALVQANLTLAEIENVEVVGGGWRIPKVQELLEKHLNQTLSTHLNGDEAMAEGAAFFGANLSSIFRTRKIVFTDSLWLDYTLVFEEISGKTQGATNSSTVIQMPIGTPIGQPIHIPFPQAEKNLRAALYENGGLLSTFEIKGISGPVKAAKSKNASHLQNYSVMVHAGFDSNGIFEIKKAELILEEIVVPDKQNSSSNATGSDSNASSNISASTRESTDSNSSEGSSSPSENASKNITNDTIKIKTKKRRIQLNITFVSESGTPLPMRLEDKQKSSAALQALNIADAQAKELDSAKNALESFVYYAREKMDNEHCQKVSTEDARSAISSETMKIEDWLYEDGSSTSLEDYQKKLDSLKKQVDPITQRAQELELRATLGDHNISTAVKDLHSTLEFVRKNMTWVNESNISSCAALVKDFEDWFDKVQADQEKAALTDPLHFTVDEVKRRLKDVQRRTKRLARTKKVDDVDAEVVNTTSASGKSGNASNKTKNTSKSTGKKEKSEM